MERTIVYSDFSVICRLCLKHATEIIKKDIFQEDIQKILKEVLNNIQMYVGDGLPHLICIDCFEIVQSFKGFKALCQENDALLREVFAKNSNELKNSNNTAYNINCQESNLESNYELNDSSDVDFNDKSVDLNDQYNTLEGVTEESDNFIYYCKLCGNLPCPITHLTLAEHMKACHSSRNVHICYLCDDKSFKHLKNLRRHIYGTHYFGEDKKLYTCDICCKTFNFPYQLKLHAKMHSRSTPYQCNLCQKKYCRPDSLRVHKSRNHTDKGKKDSNVAVKVLKADKQYVCEECGKCFNVRDYLKVHMFSHIGIKPFCCKICDKSFGRQSVLIKHERLVHLNTENKFRCTQCDKTFKCNDNLRQHFIIHTNETPYACPYCPRTFKFRSSFHQHKATHSSGAFICDTCGKQFARKQCLKTHQMKVHNQLLSLYACKICDKKFRHATSLSKHTKLKHKVQSKNINT